MSTAIEHFVQKCKDAWTEEDKDGKGVTVVQLARILRKVAKVELTDQDIAKIFAGLDDDRNKVLTYEEFREFLEKRQHKDVQASELKEVFDSLDKDGSKCLSKDEIKAQFVDLKIPLDQVDYCFENADTNSDGKINYDEFLKAWRV